MVIRFLSSGLLMPAILLPGILIAMTATTPPDSDDLNKSFTMHPSGKVNKRNSEMKIEIDPKYDGGLLGLDGFSHVWVFWWFDQNDTPQKRDILTVHPRGDESNPLTGVFATRAPVRPNLVALTLRKILSIDGNQIRVADIDAFDGTPVIDLKPYIPASDRADGVSLPAWLTGDEEG
jgi:tRNA-Thr(GGU) m(6)t(6)A37 methyltransferase TsaA